MSSRLVANSTTVSVGSSEVAPVGVAVPMMTCVTFARSDRSRVPAPYPEAVIVISGSGPIDVASPFTSAAPVGVVSSRPTSTPTVGRSSKRFTTAGGGFGNIPWAAEIVPIPTATGPLVISSTSSDSNAAHDPTMSTIASSAPTS